MSYIELTSIGSHEKYLDNIKGESDISSKEYFHKVVCVAIDKSLVDCKSLAKEFGVNKGTISRWANKKTLPHPMARPVIVQWVESYVEAHLKELRNASIRVAAVATNNHIKLKA